MADDDYAHALVSGLVELQDLLDLLVDVLELELLEHFLSGILELLVTDVQGLDAWEHFRLQIVVLLRVRVGQLRDVVHPNRLDQQQSLGLLVQFHDLLDLVLD